VLFRRPVVEIHVPFPVSRARLIYSIAYHDFRPLPVGLEDEPSSVAFFMIVSFPEDAALTIDFSIDLLIFAVSDRFIVACLTSAAFFGATCLCPFFVLAAAFAA